LSRICTGFVVSGAQCLVGVDPDYHLAVLARSFHHMPPPVAARVFSEGTRAADKLLIIDLPRPPSLLHILCIAWALPFTPMPALHDGIISLLRAYSPSALRAIAHYADPAITIEFRKAPSRVPPTVAVASHARRTGNRRRDREPSTR
jgi:hypothetical protein